MELYAPRCGNSVAPRCGHLAAPTSANMGTTKSGNLPVQKSGNFVAPETEILVAHKSGNLTAATRPQKNGRSQKFFSFYNTYAYDKHSTYLSFCSTNFRW